MKKKISLMMVLALICIISLPMVVSSEEIIVPLALVCPKCNNGALIPHKTAWSDWYYGLEYRQCLKDPRIVDFLLYSEREYGVKCNRCSHFIPENLEIRQRWSCPLE